MRIAILGWGSVQWEPEALALAGPWQPDGPHLPLELARIRGDDCLTVVLYPTPETPALPVVWAWAAGSALAAVVENLRTAERTVPGHIAVLPDDGLRAVPLDPGIAATITRWQVTQSADAVVWTQLPANFTQRTGLPLTPTTAVAYLRGLPPADRRRAVAYLGRLPATLQTVIRQAPAAATDPTVGPPAGDGAPGC